MKMLDIQPSYLHLGGMSMHPVYGHESLRARLGAAIRDGRLPQAVLLVGPQGIGKQRLALWCAQTVLCDARTAEPCGRCHSCGQVALLVHPDLHWTVPLVPRKTTADAEKQIAEVDVALGETLAERRERSVYSAPEGTASHSVASVRRLHRIVAKKPYQGRNKVIVLGDAERLIVQEASQEAANALLKILEEPPADTVVFLTAETAAALLPTIRSRLVPIRVAPVSRDAVAAFAREVLGEAARSAERSADRAAGRIGSLIDAEVDRSAKMADRFLAAVGKGPAAWAAQALSQPPWGARGQFTEVLDALATRMQTEIRRRSAEGGKDIRKPLRALQILDYHRIRAAGNVNPQVAMAVMARELSELK